MHARQTANVPAPSTSSQQSPQVGRRHLAHGPAALAPQCEQRSPGGSPEDISDGIGPENTIYARRMRIPIAIACALVAAPAHADDTIAGVYDVTFETMTSDCNPTPIALVRGKATIAITKTGITLDLSPFPKLEGTVKDNKITVGSKRIFGTTVMGLLAKYSATGEVTGGKLELLFVADYIKQQGSKPYCKQPWKVTGGKTR